MDWLKRLAGKEEPEPSPLPDLPGYDPISADGFRVGDSPAPGLTLKRILRGHTDSINRFAWSPDGRLLASPSSDRTIRIWDVAGGECVAVLEGHTDEVYSVEWLPDGHRLASGSDDQTIRIWDTGTWQSLNVIEGHIDSVWRIAWSPDGRRLASGSDDQTIRIWDTGTWKFLNLIEGHTGSINSMAWSPDGHRLASGYSGGNVRIWDVTRWQRTTVLEGHTDWIFCVAWSPDGRRLASGCQDHTIRIWNMYTGQHQVLEGHTGQVRGVAFSPDGILFASAANDDSVQIRRCDNWNTIAVLKHESNSAFRSVSFHPFLPYLALTGEYDTAIFIWELDTNRLFAAESVAGSVRYTTAKLVLVGDSGVGKTGLGWRLAHGEFKEHSSTHGQQFWVVDDLCTTRRDGTKCEAVLWDLAGQHVYRQIHSIFLDDVDASLVLFDPTNRQDPFKGTEFWLEQLKGKGQLPPSVLVGARMDRGGSTVSADDLAQFCQRHGISGGYVGTSAKEGIGLDQLIDVLNAQIPWDAMTATVTTATFKRIKDHVLALKAAPERRNVLVQPAELRGQLQETDPDWSFTDAEMMTAVGHLANFGIVTILLSSSGETHILLTPDLLVGLASSIFLQADKHPRELGAVSETELLEDRYTFDELAGLDEDERHVLLDAAVLRFLKHSVCFRETFGEDTLLIFPGLIKQKRPLVDDFPAADDVSYVVRGRVENLYATLVVLLGHSSSFIRINQWQNQAQYEMGEGQICGFRLIEDREGEIELVLYYGERMLARGRAAFQELFEEFLYQREVEVTRYPPVMCPNGHRLDRTTVIGLIREGEISAFCPKCGKEVGLPALDRPGIGIDPSQWLQREEAVARLRSLYETYLARIKSFRREWAAPRCYLSHAPGEAAYADKLMRDLPKAGILLIEEPAQVGPDDYVVLLDTPGYQRAWAHPTPEFEGDVSLVNSRLGGGNRRLISIKLEGSPAPSHDLQSCIPGDFSDATHYPVSLFNLVLDLYLIPFDHFGFAPLRQSLHWQWEETLSELPPEDKSRMRPLKIFISYSHKDEAFKDALVVMLAGMQRRGIIDAWHDRRIEPGDEWYQAIHEAMKECDLGLLLVSRDFLASRFIQEEEIPRLLQRRIEEGMRVIPIIIRPCMWRSEPVLKDLLALPQYGKAVITFPEETGARDQVWTDIAKVVERHAKALQSGV